MPELPEVETTVRGLKKEVLGLRILGVWTDLNTKDKRKADTIANPKYFSVFKKEVSGKKIISAERRAKNILINLSPTSPRLRRASGGKTILVHLKMTGYLFVGKYTSPPNPLSLLRRGAGERSRILLEMQKVREIVSLGLQARQKAGIPVRHALNQLRIKNYELGIEYTDLIKEELNVKEIISDKNIDTEEIFDTEDEAIQVALNDDDWKYSDFTVLPVYSKNHF